MHKEETNFWKLRKQNKDGAAPGPAVELHITPELVREREEAIPALLYDIKEQLCELNYSIGTIGEMFGSYLLSTIEKYE